MRYGEVPPGMIRIVIDVTEEDAKRLGLRDLVQVGLNKPMLAQQWFTVKEAARILGVHEMTIRNRIRRGQLEHQYVGRIIRIPASAISPTPLPMPEDYDTMQPEPPVKALPKPSRS